MHAFDLSLAVGALLALLFAVFTVLYDCHVAVQERLKRVPMLIFQVPPALVLSIACGLTAAIAFFFTDGKGDTLIDSVLGLKQPNPILRGILVGLTVLVLIRSKISSFKGAEIGGELVYNSGRTWVMRSLNRKWRAFKAKFNELNLATALAFAGYQDRLAAELRDSLRTQSEDFRNFVESQLKNVIDNRPQTNFNANSQEWQTYYRTLTNLALDYSGPDVFEEWIQFRDPRKR
jgi:hypothetical protein